MRALLVNVAHATAPGAWGGDHPRHHIAPIELGICASLLERAGWRVELWDTQVDRRACSATIDALAAARHSLAVITLTGAAFANCDVTAGASPMPITVDVLDSLIVAQWAAGLPVILDCCP